MSLNKNWEIINFLAICSPNSHQCIKLNTSLLNAFQEIAYNLLFTDLPLTEPEIESLKKVKPAVRNLANRKSVKLTPQLIKTLLKPTVRLLNGGEVSSSSGRVSGTSNDTELSEEISEES